MVIYPSLLGANPLYLGDIIKKLDPFARGYHIDIMDDHFVNNLTWGVNTLQHLRWATSCKLQLHLMVDDPVRWLDPSRYQPKYGDEFIFHVEAIQLQSVDVYDQMRALCNATRRAGFIVGVAINPDTCITTIKPILDEIDEVMLMSVVPGKCGQTFIETTYKKITDLHQLRSEQSHTFLIGVDGGVGLNQVQYLASMQVDFCAVASAIFQAVEPLDALRELEQISKKK